MTLFRLMGRKLKLKRCVKDLMSLPLAVQPAVHGCLNCGNFHFLPSWKSENLTVATGT